MRSEVKFRMYDFKYRQISNKKQFSNRRRKKSAIKNIVVHATDNPRNGADAEAHVRYLEHADRFGSAHYYVDDHSIYQPIGDTYIAWHCADNQGFGKSLNGVTNSNSIGVEMCMNSDGIFSKTYKNTVELVKNLMKIYNLTVDNVCRHYDVSKKKCPSVFKYDNWAKWKQFKKDIAKPVEWEIDLSKDSTFGPDKTVQEFSNISSWAKEAWNWGKEKGITDGTYPKKEATREEVITMLYRMWGIK